MAYTLDRTLDTIPKLLLDHSKKRGDRPANRQKEFGIWQSWSWSDVAEEVRCLACGLAKKGFQRGDKLAVIGDNRPRLYWSMVAAQALGGIPVPLYQDSVAEEMVYVLENADFKFAIDSNEVSGLIHPSTSTSLILIISPLSSPSLCALDAF